MPVSDTTPAGATRPNGWGFVVDVAQRRTTADPGNVLPGIDPYAAHQRQVDHQTIIATGVACHPVTAAAYGRQQVVFTRRIDTMAYVGNTRAAHDCRRTLVDHAVVQDPCFVVNPRHPDITPGRERCHVVIE